MGRENLIDPKVFESRMDLLNTLARGEKLGKFINDECKIIAHQNFPLSTLLSATLESGSRIFENFNNVHYLLGATLAYMLITESQVQYNGTISPITPETLDYYREQSMTIAEGKGYDNFVLWLKEQTHLFVPMLATYFEDDATRDLPPEMYFGMVDVAHPFAIEAKILS